MNSCYFHSGKKLREMKKRVIFLSLLREKNIKIRFFPCFPIRENNRDFMLFSSGKKTTPLKGGKHSVSLTVKGVSSRASSLRTTTPSPYHDRRSFSLKERACKYLRGRYAR